jgi:hypothetical protein
MPPSSRAPRAAPGAPAFPLDELRVTGATLTASIRWGEAEGPDALLLHEITLALAPLRVGSQRDDAPTLCVDSIRFGVTSWRQLEDRTFALGAVVRTIASDGEEHPIYDAYASLNVGEDYHPVHVSAIAFGAAEGCRLPMTCEARIEPDAAGTFEPAALSLSATLDVGAVAVVGDTDEGAFPGPDEATELAGRLLDLGAYGEPAVVDGRVTLAPRCDGAGADTSGG